MAFESIQKAKTRENKQNKTVQRQKSAPNRTGIPDEMKERFEGISGFSFDDVRVHYNSDKPAQLQALAYAQGNQVYIGPGQEKHLGHELGHVVQQKQGIVKPTLQLHKVSINDDERLERQADLIALKALHHEGLYSGVQHLSFSSTGTEVVQGAWYDWVLPVVKAATGIAAPIALSFITGKSTISDIASGAIDVLNSGKETGKQIFTTKRNIPENSTVEIKKGTIERFAWGFSNSFLTDSGMPNTGDIINIPDGGDINITAGSLELAGELSKEKEDASAYIDRVTTPLFTALGGLAGIIDALMHNESDPKDFASNFSSSDYVTGNINEAWDNIKSLFTLEDITLDDNIIEILSSALNSILHSFIIL